MRSEVAGADERRAERLRHIAQRLKYGCSTVTRMTAVKRVAHVKRQHRRRPAIDMTGR
jgi:hypothetical protein